MANSLVEVAVIAWLRHRQDVAKAFIWLKYLANRDVQSLYIITADWLVWFGNVTKVDSWLACQFVICDCHQPLFTARCRHLGTVAEETATTEDKMTAGFITQLEH